MLCGAKRKPLRDASLAAIIASNIAIGATTGAASAHDSRQQAAAPQKGDPRYLEWLERRNAELAKELAEFKRGKPQKQRTASPVQTPKEAYAAVPADYDGIAKDPHTLEGAKENNQRFFLRREAIDAAYYLYPLRGALDTKGAALTVTRDDLAGSTAVAVQAFSSYVALRPELPPPPRPVSGAADLPVLSGYAAAPFIYANGQLGEPRKASERSALQFGIDNQIEFAGGLFPLQTLRVTPYGQTDFRGLASIGGISSTYEPYLPGMRLGGNPNLGPQLVGYYFRAIGEADVFRVDNAGLTDFLPRTSYAYVGGTVQFNATLFQNMPEMKELCGRVHFSAQYQYYRDVANNLDLRNFHTEASVDLGGKPSRFCLLDGEKYVEAPGAMAVALTYDQGTDKTTLVDAKKYQLQLTLKY